LGVKEAGTKSIVLSIGLLIHFIGAINKYREFVAASLAFYRSFMAFDDFYFS
jgi:hypothetical protein